MSATSPYPLRKKGLRRSQLPLGDGIPPAQQARTLEANGTPASARLKRSVGIRNACCPSSLLTKFANQGAKVSVSHLKERLGPFDWPARVTVQTERGHPHLDKYWLGAIVLGAGEFGFLQRKRRSE